MLRGEPGAPPFFLGSAYFSGFLVGVKRLPGDKMHMAPTTRLQPSPFTRHADGPSLHPKGFSGLGYGQKAFNWLAAGHLGTRVSPSMVLDKKAVV